MKTVCIHHAECIDGTAAAAVVRMKHKDAILFPRFYGDPPPANLKGARVFVVDFSYPEEILRRIRSEAAEFFWYDHHKSALPLRDRLGFGVVDLNECGATLTWKQLFPGKKIPKILLYVQDKDIWLWRLPQSREVSAAMRDSDGIFEPTHPVWRRWLKGPSAKEWRQMIAAGKQSRRLLRDRIKRAVEKGFPVDLDGIKAMAVNWVEDASDIGEYIYKEGGYPLALLFSYSGTDWKFSLRSATVDVAEIAGRLGGGGHRGAAGFRMSDIAWLLARRVTTS